MLVAVPRGAEGALRGCGGWIRTSDLEVMSLASYQAAPPRVEHSYLKALS